MSFEKAKEHLIRFVPEDRIKQYEVSSATVALAAEAIGCPPERIAKTLAMLVQEKPVLIMASGETRIDNPLFKQRFGVKATMIPADRLNGLVGHEAGGVCPFGIKDGVEVWLDESLRRFDYVYPACGSENSVVRLTLDELISCSGASGWVDVCKGWR